MSLKLLESKSLVITGWFSNTEKLTLRTMKQNWLKLLINQPFTAARRIIDTNGQEIINGDGAGRNADIVADSKVTQQTE